ncbi:plant glycogenin-like starch initiation protein 3 [Perilla frutescens var. frutescens]|nr:plant glycogenin-like starch initiation protein 3 [Perilla frutescens var. frutescens]
MMRTSPNGGSTARLSMYPLRKFQNNSSGSPFSPNGSMNKEEEYSGSRCPEIPMPEWEEYGLMDMIVVELPCKKPDVGWNRDVFRLQVHLAAANAEVKKGRWDWKGRMEVVVLSKCPAMVELFRCEEVVKREGEWWLYRPEMWRLEQKVFLPVGSCNLALPLWSKDLSDASK